MFHLITLCVIRSTSYHQPIEVTDMKIPNIVAPNMGRLGYPMRNG